MHVRSGLIVRIVVLVLGGVLIWKGQPASPPTPAEPVQRATAAPLGVQAAPPSRLTPAELTLVHYLRGARIGRERLLAAAAELEQFALTFDHGRGTSRHHEVYAAWLREQIGLVSDANVNAWDRAMLAYLAARPDPAEAVVKLALARDDRFIRSKAVPMLYCEWSTGLFTPQRGWFLIDSVRPYIDPASLLGATVADIGAGPGQMSRALVDLVGPAGRVIAVDVDPTTDDLQPILSQFDPPFRRVEFRIVHRDGADPGVRPSDAVQAAFLMDVHILGQHEGSDEQRCAWQIAWLNRVYAALKPGGVLIVYEGGGAAPPLEQVLPVLQRSRFGDKVVGHDSVHRRGGNLQRGYVIVATKQGSSKN